MKKFAIKKICGLDKSVRILDRRYSSETSAKKAATYFSNHQLLHIVYPEFDSQFIVIEL